METNKLSKESIVEILRNYSYLRLSKNKGLPEYQYVTDTYFESVADDILALSSPKPVPTKTEIKTIAQRKARECYELDQVYKINAYIEGFMDCSEWMYGKIGKTESKVVAPSGAEEIKQHEHCKNCGFVIPYGAGYCVDCDNYAD